jgi:hypothetical protein
MEIKEPMIANGHHYQVKYVVAGELKSTKMTELVNLLLFNKF